MLVTCNNCKKDFEATLYETRKTIKGHNVTRTFFECPFCAFYYGVCFHTKKTLRLQKKIHKTPRSKVGEIRTLKKQLREEMEANKRKYAECF